MPEGHITAHVTVTDPERHGDYVRLDAPAVERFGGRFVVGGGAAKVLEGGSKDRHVVIAFDDMATARAFYDSPECREAAAIRREAAEADFVPVEGP